MLLVTIKLLHSIPTLRVLVIVTNRNRESEPEHAVTVNCATRRYFHVLVLLALLAATSQVAQVGFVL